MVDGLMHDCRMWGAPVCNPEVSKEHGTFETGLGKPAHEWPCGEEQRRLDRICSSCTHRLFEVDSLECPICEQETLKPRKPFTAISSGPMKPSLTEFFYTCSICDTQCFSSRDLSIAK